MIEYEPDGPITVSTTYSETMTGGLVVRSGIPKGKVMGSIPNLVAPGSRQKAH